MTKTPTKQELEKEIENLKFIIKILTETQSRIVDSSFDMIRRDHKITRRYQAKMHNLDRVFGKQTQICLLIALIANTIFLALRFL